jgi:hypothetical protein
MRNHTVAFEPVLKRRMEAASMFPNNFEELRPRCVFGDNLLLADFPVDELAV